MERRVGLRAALPKALVPQGKPKREKGAEGVPPSPRGATGRWALSGAQPPHPGLMLGAVL